MGRCHHSGGFGPECTNIDWCLADTELRAYADTNVFGLTHDQMDYLRRRAAKKEAERDACGGPFCTVVGCHNWDPHTHSPVNNSPRCQCTYLLAPATDGGKGE